jgi:hypothetical protein
MSAEATRRTISVPSKRIDKAMASLHETAYANRIECEAKEICGCFYCCNIFPSTKITSYLDVTLAKSERTAVCPHCDLDTVLPGVTDRSTLKKMQVFWFGEIKPKEEKEEEEKKVEKIAEAKPKAKAKAKAKART